MELNTELLKRYPIESASVSNGRGYWNSTRVDIFSEENGRRKKIGEYLYNYHSSHPPFHPFTQGGRHYALYSRNYTATRVMALPDCRDLGGEEPESFGFCPVEYAVPFDTFEVRVNPHRDPEPVVENHRPQRWACVGTPDKYRRYYWPGDADTPFKLPHWWGEIYKAQRDLSHARHREWDRLHPFETRRMDGEIGFVSGCVWGDDTSWKVQMLDLSRAAEGRVTRTDALGYLELPRGIGLADAITIWDWGEDRSIEVAAIQRFDLSRQATKP